MDEVIKVGLVEQLRVLKLYLKDYEKAIKDNSILTKDEYDTLLKYSESVYERLTLQSIDEKRNKEIELWLHK